MMTFSVAKAHVIIIKVIACLMIRYILKTGKQALSATFNLLQRNKSKTIKSLHVLKAAGIIVSQKTGIEMIDRLKLPSLADFLSRVTVFIENSVKRRLICLP